MAGEALTLMRELQAEVARSGASNLYEHTSEAWVQQFGQQLEGFEPFRTVANSWIAAPMGGGRQGKGIAGKWVWVRLLSGDDPKAVLASASSTVERNRYEAREVRPVKGVTIAEPHRLTTSASLVPNDALTKDWPHQRAFGNEMLGPYFPTDTAALVQDIIVHPAMVASNTDQDEVKMTKAREQRDGYAARLRLALGLAGGGPVELPLVYAQIEADCIFNGQGSSLSQTPTMTYFGNDVSIDVETTLQIFGELERMNQPRALELSIDRLLRSRLGRSLEDRIIDLGMAAEIALMHSPKGSGEGKSELTNKLSTRGAWLVTNNAADRLAVSALLSELYSARSTVVHTGLASGKLQARISPFDEVVVKIARALLVRGAFPDWKSLVLGGDGLFAP